MSDSGVSRGKAIDKKTVESFPLTDDERRLVTWYREMSERDRRYIRRVAEVLSAASG